MVECPAATRIVHRINWYGATRLYNAIGFNRISYSVKSIAPTCKLYAYTSGHFLCGEWEMRDCGPTNHGKRTIYPPSSLLSAPPPSTSSTFQPSHLPRPYMRRGIGYKFRCTLLRSCRVPSSGVERLLFFGNRYTYVYRVVEYRYR